MEIKVGQKWVNCKELIIESPIAIYHFNIGDVTVITNINLDLTYPYSNEICSLSKKEILDNFILLSEWRDKQIDSILND